MDVRPSVSLTWIRDAESARATEALAANYLVWRFGLILSAPGSRAPDARSNIFPQLRLTREPVNRLRVQQFACETVVILDYDVRPGKRYPPRLTRFDRVVENVI